MNDPYRTEPERPMSELTRDKLLIYTAALSSFSAVVAVTRYPSLVKDVVPLVEDLKKLLETAKQEMGIR